MLLQYINDQIQQSGFARTQNEIKTKLKCLYHRRRPYVRMRRPDCTLYLRLALVSICEIDVTSFSEDGRGIKWLCN